MKILHTRLALSLLLGAAAAASPAADSDWPQFRGPEHNGASHSGVLASASFGLEIDWKRPLGSGYSAISVVSERAVTMFTDGEKDYVVSFALDDGEELWRLELAEMYRGHGGSSDGPISTPTIHDGVVYALGAHGHLVAASLETGEELWRVELDGETNSREPVWGYSTTPIVSADRVIVLTGGDSGYSITAFDARSGDLSWHSGDDRVGYQSPTLTDLSGEPVVVAATDNELKALRPRDGSVVWSHRYGDDNDEGFGQPVLLPEGRILLNTWEEAIMFQLSEEQGEYSVEELWRSRNLKRTYALPVYHEGYLYGFNGRFLSCIDPDTGEAVWRSRPPGGDGLILVDGRLVITAAEGDLVVADANPEGYREMARIPLFEDTNLTFPSIVGKYIYARNDVDVARVRITESRTTEMKPAPEQRMEIPEGEFGDFVRGLTAADQRAKERMVDDFMDSQESFPVIEGEGKVHFVYRGEVEDVALLGSMLDDGEEVPLSKVDGTDFYFHTLDLDPEGHWEYRYSVNYGDLIEDPHNRLSIGSLSGPSSELRMPRWPVPAHVAVPEGPRGRIEAFQFESRILENEREIQVYLPAGYRSAENAGRRYPLVLYNNGDSALDNARIDRSLDNLIGRSVEPMIVALLPRVGAEFGGPPADDYVRMLSDELVPHLDATYRTQTEPSTRTILGVGSGAYISAYAALTAPGHFGKLATQSLYVNRATEEAFWKAIDEGEPQPIEIYIEWSRHDYDVPDADLDAAADSEEFANRLSARGYTIERSFVTGAAGWGAWRATIDQILEGFYPL